ncbi:MAG: hypothetical protein EYC62_04945 [Alphaproteobacteria bacterium]|nr:MAG: hypothetical protein EYC62_04945 [Alphaproteobacteria bacterium]
MIQKLKQKIQTLPPRRRLWTLVFLMLIGFFAVNYISNTYLSGWQVDLTEDKQHSLSAGSIKTLQELQENIDVYFYYSKRLDYESPDHALFARQVKNLLNQYSNISKGRIRLHDIDPEPYSEQEDRAIEYGIRPIPLYGGAQQAYFGLYVRSGLGNSAAIQQFTPSRAGLLEYDLTRIFYAMLHPKLPKIGVITSLPMDADYFSPLARGDGAPAPWFFWLQLQQSYQIEKLAENISAIPDHVEVLLIVHPKNLTEQAMYAIDQYMLRNGKAVILLDPHSEAAAARKAASKDMPPQNSDLGKLLDHWKIKIDPNFVVGDKSLAHRVVIENPDPQARSQSQAVNYAPWLRLGVEQMNAQDVLSANTKKINLATAGAIEMADGASLRLTPLIQTTTHSMKIPVEKIRYMPNPEEIAAEFKDSGEVYTLAARLTGNLTSTFDAPPSPPKDIKLPEFIKESQKPANIILLADSDMTDDRFWVQVPETLQAGYIIPSSGNGDFILNAIDNILGGDAFLGLRTRDSANRPLTVLNDIRKSAEEKFSAQQKDLQAKLKSAEEKLKELQSESKEKQAEDWQQTIVAAQKDILTTRSALRRVQLDLNRDIQGIENTIRLILILIWPLLWAIILIFGLKIWRGRKVSY